MDHTYGKAGSFQLTKARAAAMGWKDRWTMQGCATLRDRLWRYTGNAGRTDPAALTEYSWSTGKEVARHNGPKDAGWTGSGIWEPEAWAIVNYGVIKVWYGIVRGVVQRIIAGERPYRIKCRLFTDRVASPWWSDLTSVQARRRRVP